MLPLSRYHTSEIDFNCDNEVKPVNYVQDFVSKFIISDVTDRHQLHRRKLNCRQYAASSQEKNCQGIWQGLLYGFDKAGANCL